MIEPRPQTQVFEHLRDDLYDPQAPVLGVHTMSEFIFCPLAGAISSEQLDTDRGSELIPTLGGLPTHDIDRIRERMEHLSHALKVSCVWSLGTILLFTLMLLIFGDWGVFFVVPIAIALSRCLRQFFDYRVLRRRLRLAERAVESSFDPRSPATQNINWWELIRAGYTSVEPRATLSEDDIRLQGKPWRILQHRDMFLPVIKINAPNERRDLREGRLHTQQFARLAAYASLLYFTQRVVPEWAIVIFNNSYDGIAIPLDHNVWRHLQHGLPLARERFQAHKNPDNFLKRPGKDSHICASCPFGIPRRVGRPTVLNGIEVLEFTTESENGERYHSTCGDRFRWVPPTKAAKSLGLLK